RRVLRHRGKHGNPGGHHKARQHIPNLHSFLLSFVRKQDAINCQTACPGERFRRCGSRSGGRAFAGYRTRTRRGGHEKSKWPGVLKWRLKFAKVKVGGYSQVNWGFQLLRISIILCVLTLLFLSQRFWYRGLWRISAEWHAKWLRVVARSGYVVGLLLVILAT